MSISVGQVRGNPKEAAEMIAVLETENERLKILLARAADLLGTNEDAAMDAINLAKEIRSVLT